MSMKLHPARMIALWSLLLSAVILVSACQGRVH
jgi:hypothetical protein